MAEARSGRQNPDRSFALGQRLKVLSLIESVADTGGAERLAVGIATHLPQERFESWICSTRAADPRVVDTLEAANVRHVHLGRQTKTDFHRFRKLVNLLRRERFDVLHAHMFGSNLWGTLIGRTCMVPGVIAHEHGWSYEDDRLRLLLNRHLIGQLATCCVAGSSATREQMIARERVRAEKIAVIPVAYVPRAGQVVGDLRAELGLAADTPLTAVVAVLRPEKALGRVLEAHARVLERIPTTHLVVAGDGACRDQLERQAQALGLSRRVHFLGYRSDTDSILQAADIALLSSDFEGGSLVACECMANHTPLVAPAVGGLRDLVVDGRTGVLVRPGDSAALGDAVVDLLLDPERRRRMGTAAGQRLSLYTIDAVSQEFASLYDDLVARSTLRTSVARNGARR